MRSYRTMHVPLRLRKSHIRHFYVRSSEVLMSFRHHVCVQKINNGKHRPPSVDPFLYICDGVTFHSILSILMDAAKITHSLPMQCYTECDAFTFLAYRVIAVPRHAFDKDTFHLEIKFISTLASGDTIRGQCSHCVVVYSFTLFADDKSVSFPLHHKRALRPNMFHGNQFFFSLCPTGSDSATATQCTA